ncbi:hypothetical protein HY440_00080 [Candidatus Microgenomates bacterium]|nr:hypothetical protein [Candidatus Microgenomates bacterium]
MKRYQLFLAYYTLAISAAIFAWSIFWGPKPQSFILAAIFIPVAIYFGLVFSGHSTQDFDQQEQNKIPLVILATLFISTISLLAYNLTNPTSADKLSALSSQIQSLRGDIASLNKPTADPNASTAAEIKKIKADLTNLKLAQSGSDLTSVLSADASSGIVTIKDSKNKTVNVYQDKSLSATISAKIEFGKTYPFIDKDPNWYLVLVSGKQGFVQSLLLKEVQN